MRQSSASIAELKAQRPVWEPPRGMTAAARVIWREVVVAVSADHFAQGDSDVLRRYCEAEAHYRKLLKERRRLPMVAHGEDERATVRLVVAELATLRGQLATYSRILRLAPSTRDNRERRTDMPVRNAPAKKKEKGDDLLA